MVPLKTLAAATAILIVTAGGGLAQVPSEAQQSPPLSDPAPAVTPAPDASAETLQPGRTPAPVYGAPIGFEAAKRAMAAAEAEAAKSTAPVVIAILDSSGRTVMLHRLDNAQHVSLRLAEGKARTALDFRRATRDLEDAVARGGAGLRLLGVPDVTPIEGGLPIVVNGAIVGAIGVSGSGGRDSEIAQAAADAAK